MIRFRRRSWRGVLQSAWCAVYRRRTCCRALAASAGRNCWAIRSVLVEPTIGYCTCRFRRPKTISHDDAIAASCASLRHSGRGREADVLMYPAALSARPFSIDKLFVPSCILAIGSESAMKNQSCLFVCLFYHNVSSKIFVFCGGFPAVFCMGTTFSSKAASARGVEQGSPRNSALYAGRGGYPRMPLIRAGIRPCRATQCIQSCILCRIARSQV